MALVTRLLAGKPSMQVSDALTGTINLPSAGLEVGDFELISKITLNIAQSNVTFNTIPQNYKHLEIRYTTRTSNNYQFDFLNMVFNNDTSTSYRTHMLSGSGASASAEDLGASGSFYGTGICPGNTNTSGVFGVGIISILDYKSTGKYKTIRTLSGFNNNDTNNGRQVAMSSGVYIKSDAVSTITLNGNGGNLSQGSSFGLYGIRG